MPVERSEIRTAWALLAGCVGLRIFLAARWDLLADEAWYAVWSEQLAAGYYDQPPAIAWVLAAARLFSDHPLALRAVPIAMGAAIPLVLYSAAGDRTLWLWWCALVPPIAWLTVFATPDALLLGCWAVGLASAIRGGRAWLVAGVAAGLAFECKHTGALLLPLLALAAPEDLRSPWPWLGALLALALAAPNLVWNAQHDWVTVGFQLGEGLLHQSPPGAVGVPIEVVGQLLVATPILGLLGYAWVAANARSALHGERALRLAWWTSAPLLAFFALAGALAPADAHWPAPAWIGIGIGLSHATGRWARAAWTGLGLAALITGFAALHTWTPIARLPVDPATRLTEGPVLAAVVARIAAPADPAAPPLLVYTERYQEAAFIRFYAGLDANVLRGCGRPGQQDLWPEPSAQSAIFLRPRTSGPPTCIGPEWTVVRGPVPVGAADAHGRTLGPWQIFELSRL